jgi:phosphoribosylamine--glycine ligase
MLVAGGYPGDYAKGDIISLPTVDNEESIIFHAGVKNTENQLLTNGGRVMAITSFGNDILEAVSKSNAIAEKITYKGKYYRTDIGKDLL